MTVTAATSSRTLTSEQAASHTWTPDVRSGQPLSRGRRSRTATVRIHRHLQRRRSRFTRSGSHPNSTDPVGAPILYRDVPLLPAMPQGEHGIIKPLPDSLLPYVKWRLRYLDEIGSKIVMSDLPTCANCHSASRDGKVLGLDVDGPSNNKALYSLMPLKPVSSMNKESIVQWSRFTEGSAQRFGFMSQVSPDGKYVVTSVEVPGARSQRSRRPPLSSQLPGVQLRPGLLSHSRRPGLVQPRKRQAATATRGRRSALRASLRLLESRRQLSGLLASGSARSLSPRPTRRPLRQRPQRAADSIRPLPHPVSRRTGRQAGANPGRFAER